eukprot:s1482_g7.t1
MLKAEAKSSPSEVEHQLWYRPCIIHRALSWSSLPGMLMDEAYYTFRSNRRLSEILPAPRSLSQVILETEVSS